MARGTSKRGAGSAFGIEPDANTAFRTGGAVDPEATRVGGGSGSVGGEPDGSARSDSADNTGGTRRGPGRPPGSAANGGTAARGTTAQAKAETLSSVGSIATSLMGIHGMLAAFTGIEEMALEDGEARGLAQGIVNVAQYHPAVRIPAEATAWIGLIMACGKVYGPRALIVREKIQAKRRQTTVPRT